MNNKNNNQLNSTTRMPLNPETRMPLNPETRMPLNPETRISSTSSVFLEKFSKLKNLESNWSITGFTKKV